MSSDTAVRKASGALAILAIAADVVAIAALAWSVAFQSYSPSLPSALALTMIVAILFIFGMFLFAISHGAFAVEAFFFLFGWLYVFLSAGILALLTSEVFSTRSMSGLTLTGYLVAVTFVGGLGVMVILRVDESQIARLALPYMAVALLHIVLWVSYFLELSDLAPDWRLLRTILLFVYTGGVILFLTKHHT